MSQFRGMLTHIELVVAVVAAERSLESAKSQFCGNALHIEFVVIAAPEHSPEHATQVVVGAAAERSPEKATSQFWGALCVWRVSCRCCCRCYRAISQEVDVAVFDYVSHITS